MGAGGEFCDERECLIDTICSHLRKEIPHLVGYNDIGQICVLSIFTACCLEINEYSEFHGGDMFATTNDDFKVEYELVPIADDVSTDEEQRILDGLILIEERMGGVQQKIDLLDKDIDKLTAHGDILDYSIAVASGVICGVLDSFLGNLDVNKANVDGSATINKKIIRLAQKKGYKGDKLSGAVSFLEKKYQIPADKVTSKFGGALQHHLRDFTHHPTPAGLCCSILTQFTGEVYGTNKAGDFIKVPLSDKSLIGTTFKEKITLGVTNWIFHLASDAAGASSSIISNRLGTGIPGPIMSLVKELSATPLFKKARKGNDDVRQLSLLAAKVFNGTIGDKNVPLDLRTEVGLAGQVVKKQTSPVIINETVVRAFYFLRRFARELSTRKIKSMSELAAIDWTEVIPANNRTITRMLTISTGAFTLIDVGSAAATSSVSVQMLLKINYVGIGRFLIAAGYDSYSEVKKHNKDKERMQEYIEYMSLQNTKLSFVQAGVWKQAANVEESINQLMTMSDEVASYCSDSASDIRDKLGRISDHIPRIQAKNPGLDKEIKDALKWG